MEIIYKKDLLLQFCTLTAPKCDSSYLENKKGEKRITRDKHEISKAEGSVSSLEQRQKLLPGECGCFMEQKSSGHSSVLSHQEAVSSVLIMHLTFISDKYLLICLMQRTVLRTGDIQVVLLSRGLLCGEGAD